MKNINQKTLIFYTFQLNPESQYNVTALKNDISQPKIKDVLWHLPIDLASGKYHFRFKSQFSEANQKVVGWIDIMNLMAKVPIFNNSIYVKILKLEQPDRSKIFTRQKLQKVGLVAMENGVSPHGSQKKISEKQGHHSHSLDPRNKSNIPPLKVNNHKTKSGVDLQQFNVTGDSNKLKGDSISNLDEQFLSESKSQGKKKQHKGSGDGSLMDFDESQNKSSGSGANNRKKTPAPQTPQQKLAHIKKIHEADEQAKRLQILARDQLEQRINNWGYSGKKIINNLTTLLATLQQIWPTWEPISLGDLQTDQKINAIYKKAAIQTHPDKNRKKDYKDKYLAKRVFQLLNQAKKAYKN